MRTAKFSKKAYIFVLTAFLGAQLFLPFVTLAQAGGVPTVPADAPANYATKITSAKSLIESTLQTSKAFAQHFKEFIGDGFANMVAKTVLRTITQSIVNWINSGFKGSPSFVTNPEGFLADITDQVIGQTIEELAPFFCSPFRFDLRLALGLNLSFGSERETHCRLSDVITNVEGFYSDFAAGEFASWSAWMNVTGTPGNNPYGAYLSTVSQMNARIVNAQGQTLTELDWGKGFQSWRECEVPGKDIIVTNKDGTTKMDPRNPEVPLIRKGPCQKKGPVRTPGTVIEGQLQTALGVDLQALGFADEINEIFAALVNQLVKQVFTSTGLAGTANYSYNVDTSDVSSVSGNPQQGENGITITDFNSIVSGERGTIARQDTRDGMRTVTDAGSDTYRDDILGDGGTQAVGSEIDTRASQSGVIEWSGQMNNNLTSGSLAVNKASFQSSYADSNKTASLASDGSINSFSKTLSEQYPWWQVNLSFGNNGNYYQPKNITQVKVIPETFASTEGMSDFLLFSAEDFRNISDLERKICTNTAIPGIIKYSITYDRDTSTAPVVLPSAEWRWYVRVQRCGTKPLALSEVIVLGEQRALASNETVTPPKPPIQISFQENLSQTGKDITETEELLIGKPAGTDTNIILSFKANENIAGKLRFGVKMEQKNNQGTYDPVGLSNNLQKFNIDANRNGIPFSGILPIELISIGSVCPNALQNVCLNPSLGRSRLREGYHPSQPIYYLWDQYMQQGDQIQVTSTLTFNPRASCTMDACAITETFRVTYQVFKGDAQIPSSSTSIIFTPK